MDNTNYFNYTRTEIYYNYILPIKDTLNDDSLSTEDKLIEINQLIDLFYKNTNKTKK
jgi:hypothetical protein